MISLRRFLKVTLLGDKGYDSDAIVEHVAILGAVAVIPPKRNRKQQREYDKIIYKQRNRIERCFSRLKHFHRFATRYESSKTTSRHSSPSPAPGCTFSYMSILPKE
jgi:transposase